MKPKHTPGPWHVYLNAKKPMVRANSKRMIMQIIPHPGDAPIGNYYSDEDMANARLISAAPDMLEALNEVCEQLREYDPKNEALKKGWSVIAKAEGKEK